MRPDIGVVLLLCLSSPTPARTATDTVSQDGTREFATIRLIRLESPVGEAVERLVEAR
jgi:hypothetical protein